MIDRLIEKIENWEDEYIKHYIKYKNKLENSQTNKDKNKKIKENYIGKIQNKNFTENPIENTKQDIEEKLINPYNYEERLKKFLALKSELDNLENNWEVENKQKIKQIQSIKKEINKLQIWFNEFKQIFKIKELSTFLNSEYINLLKDFSQNQKKSFLKLILDNSPIYIINIK